jgi:hypothetical protein
MGKESIVYNRHLAFGVAGLFILPVLAATAQEIRDSRGGRFIVGPDGAPYLVMADGLRGVFVDGPDGTPYIVMDNGLRGEFGDGPTGVASPVTGDRVGGVVR